MHRLTSSNPINQHTMKYHIKAILFLFLVIFMASCAKEVPKTFTINGSISPAKADFIILQKETDIERQIVDVIDTINVNEKGNFQVSYDEEPYLYSLLLPNKEKVALAINTNQSLTVTISKYAQESTSVQVTGSTDTDALHAYENFRIASLDRLVESVRRDITALKKEDEPDVEKLAELGLLELTNYELHLRELNDYITQNMGTSLGLYATSIRWKGAKNLPLFDSLATAYERAHPNLGIAKKLREKVTRLQQTAIGGQAAGISMQTSDGEQVNLASIKSKYILIDFWASWCGPCRRESAGLNELYTKYTRENFDIYGVSLDDKKQLWLAALEKDNRGWTNVSSLQRFKTPAAFDYAVTALPDNYLIDENRKIIAKNVHREELENLLNELLMK